MTQVSWNASVEGWPTWIRYRFLGLSSVMSGIVA